MIAFTKAEGAQNDFVIVEDLGRTIPHDVRVAFSRAVCHRRRGVGGDGVIIIERSEKNDFTMVFHNPDGSTGSMCGNGGRSAALYAFHKGIAGRHMRFDVLGRTYAADVLEDGIRLFFPPPMRIDRDLSLDTPFGEVHAHFVHNGAPHVVLFFDELPEVLTGSFDTLDMQLLGRSLRHHAHFAPEGANVNVVMRTESEYRIRTYEKGVEGETEACGTGTLASGMMVHAHDGTQPPVRLRTHGGDLLMIRFNPDMACGADDPAHYADGLALEGPARLVFEGRFDETRGVIDGRSPEDAAAQRAGKENEG